MKFIAFIREFFFLCRPLPGSYAMSFWTKTRRLDCFHIAKSKQKLLLEMNLLLTLSPSATFAITFPFDGFKVSNVLPETASTNWLLMKIYDEKEKKNKLSRVFECKLVSIFLLRHPLVILSKNNYLCVFDFLVWIGHFNSEKKKCIEKMSWMNCKFIRWITNENWAQIRWNSVLLVASFSIIAHSWISIAFIAVICACIFCSAWLPLFNVNRFIACFFIALSSHSYKFCLALFSHLFIEYIFVIGIMCVRAAFIVNSRLIFTWQ